MKKLIAFLFSGLFLTYQFVNANENLKHELLTQAKEYTGVKNPEKLHVYETPECKNLHLDSEAVCEHSSDNGCKVGGKLISFIPCCEAICSESD